MQAGNFFSASASTLLPPCSKSPFACAMSTAGSLLLIETLVSAKKLTVVRSAERCDYEEAYDDDGVVNVESPGMDDHDSESDHDHSIGAKDHKSDRDHEDDDDKGAIVYKDLDDDDDQWITDEYDDEYDDDDDDMPDYPHGDENTWTFEECEDLCNEKLSEMDITLRTVMLLDNRKSCCCNLITL